MQAVSVKIVLVAACALIDADGRVLIAQRPAGRQMAGLWEFPGGKVEAGETPEATLIRELKEELGIIVNEACLAPLTFGERAVERLRDRESPPQSWYLDLGLIGAYVGGSTRRYHHTAPIVMIYALHAGLGAILD